MATTKVNFIAYTKNNLVIQRINEVSADFSYSNVIIDNMETLYDMDLDSKYHDVQLVFFDSAAVTAGNSLTDFTQTIKQMFPEIFVFILAEKKISPNEVDFLKKSGADFVMLDDDFIQTSRFEYIASQVIRAAYIPVKLTELIKDSTLNFTLYHLMPLNQKLFPMFPKGSPITEAKLKKLEGTGELYIRRDDLALYNDYYNKLASQSSANFTQRCRARYLMLCQSHSKFVFNLMDQSQSATFEEGKRLFDICKKLSEEILMSLTAAGDPWDIVNNSAFGEFGSIERCPAIASYAGLLALTGGFADPNKVMVVSLLSDLGLLDLSPKITRKMRQVQGLNSLTEEEFNQYREHPKTSVNICLDKRVALDNSMRESILCTHERTDRTGFPDKKGNIPVESMVVHYCEMVDGAAMLTMGKARVPVTQIRKDVIASEIENAKIFSYNFLLSMKKILA